VKAVNVISSCVCACVVVLCVCRCDRYCDVDRAGLNLQIKGASAMLLRNGVQDDTHEKIIPSDSRT